MAVSEQVEKIKISIQEAEKDVDIAERHLKDSQLRLTYLKNQLQECFISGVSGLKAVDQNNNVKEPAYKPPENEDEREPGACGASAAAGASRPAAPSPIEPK